MLSRLSVARRAARAVSRFHTSAKTQEASQFTMPALSPTMTEGGIARWEKKEGEAYSAGDLLLQIETDKAQMDVEAQDDGILVKILAPEGSQGVRVNSPIAIVAEDGDDIASIDVAALSKPKDAGGETAAAAAATPEKPKEVEKPKEAVKPQIAQETHHGADRSASGVLAPAAAFAVHANHIANAAEIQGTGPKGRVLKGDVLQFLRSGKAVISKQQPAASAAASTSAQTPRAPVSAAPAPSADAETAFLVRSLESSVLRRISVLELAKKTTVVSVPFDRLSSLLKGSGRGLTTEAFVLRAAAVAAQQVKVAKDGGARVGVAVEGSRAPVVVDIADAATMGVAAVAEAIQGVRKNAQPANAGALPAVVLAAEGVYSPENLPKDGVVVVVGSAHVVVSEAEAAGALDWALDQLVGGGADKTGEVKKGKVQSVVDVSVIGESPAVPAFAAKIKALLSNPELLTF
ncbi:pyridoxine biosynthesis protein [Coemansia interrupta]|uniref:Pyridoxine biosynthesis protein n=1 Tax=Coemansia interrupta TaxID=1126814 RepID=A0A9W8H8R4_9FUNG|nr:pyridoxine biosynthesis protein [Coemansia interrupta]